MAATATLTLPGDRKADHAVFSSDSRHVLVACAEPLAIHTFDAATGTLLSVTVVPFVPAPGDNTSACVLGDGGALLVSVGNLYVTVHETNHMHELAGAGTHDGRAGVFVSPDGSLLCLYGLSASITLRRIRSDALHAEGERVVDCGAESVDCCALNSDSTQLLVATDDRPELQLFDVSTGQVLYTLSGHDAHGASSCAFSPCDALLLSGGCDCTLMLWDAYTGTRMRTFEGHTGTVLHCAFSACGHMVLSASDDGTAKLWAVSTGACVRTLVFDTPNARHCAFSPDGARVALVTADAAVLLWDITAERDRCSPFAGVPAPAPTMGGDMLQLLRSGADSDVLLRAACGREFPAHRAILRLRSATLAARLSGAFSDSRAAVDVPDDIPAAVLGRLLEFLYADALTPESADEAAALLHAADYFGVLRLRAICERSLADALQPATVAATLQLADRHSAPALRTAALWHAAEHAAEMVDSEAWRRLVSTQPQLMADVVYTLAKGVVPPLRGAAAALEAAPEAAPSGAAAAAAAAAAADGAAAADEGRRTRQRLQ
jgi:hypothetical protein